MNGKIEILSERRRNKIFHFNLKDLQYKGIDEKETRKVKYSGNQETGGNDVKWKSLLT